MNKPNKSKIKSIIKNVNKIEDRDSNRKIKRFSGRKRNNESRNNRKCCKCKNEVNINDSIKFKNKEELISKGIIKMEENMDNDNMMKNEMLNETIAKVVLIKY